MTDPRLTEPPDDETTPSPDDLAAAEAAALSEAIDEAETPDPEAFRDVEAEAKATRYQAALEEAAQAAAGMAPSRPLAAPAPGAKAGTAAAPGTAAAAPAEQLPYVDDRFSKLWVALIILTFVAILSYGIVAGQGGLLSPGPTPSPTPTLAPSPSPSPSTTPAGSPSGSPAGSPSPSPS
jgi:hypothetical protein